MPRGTVGFSSSSSCSSSCSFSTTRTTPGRKLFPRSLAAKSNSFLAAKKTRTAAFAAAKKSSALSGIKTNKSSSFHSEKVVSTEEEDKEEKEETKGGRDWTEKMVKSENFEKGKARALEAYSRNAQSGESILTLKTDDALNLEEHARPKWSRDLSLIHI